MEMKIYHNPRCSKSRHTLAIMEEKGVNVEIIEYLKDIPTAEELSELIKKLNISAEELVRKSEKDFKENFKSKTLTDKQWVEAMIEFPKLIERPIIVKNNKAVLGRPPENVLNLL